MIGIYKITSPTGRVYIGQSRNIAKRFKNYFNLTNCNRQVKLYRSFLKYGIHSHVFEIIEECEINSLNNKERYWQDFYNVMNDGLNCILTQTENKPQIASAETRLRISNSNKGKPGLFGSNNGMYGKCKELNPMYGKKHTISALKKMRGTKEKIKGLNNSMTKIYINEQTGIFYIGIKEAADSLGIGYSKMRHMLNPKSSTKNTTYIRNC